MLGNWESGWSDCGLRSPWLELHILHTYTHRQRESVSTDTNKLTWSFFFLLSVALPADERLDALSGDGGHGHGHRLRRGQPVGVVIARGKAADVVDVAEHVGHGAEPAQTAAS